MFTKLQFVFILIVVTLFMGGCTSMSTTPTTSTGGGFPSSGSYPPQTGGFDTATYHTVTKGETLAGIARRYGHTYQELAQWNGITPPYTIHPGQQLRVSSPSMTMGAMSSGITGTYSYPTEMTQGPPPQLITENTFPPPSGGSPPSMGDGRGELFHEVQPGESLYGIASRYGQSLHDVAAWNSIEPPYYPLTVGRRLQVSPPPGWMGSNTAMTSTSTLTDPYGQGYDGYYGSTTTEKKATVSTPKKSTLSANTSHHTVQVGDTLYNIAKRYGLSVAQVASWNGFSEPYPPLRVGQTLTIKGGSKTSGTSYLPVLSAPASASYPPSSSTSGSGYHTVAPGDTLYNIAKRYGQSVEQLAALNNMQQPYPPISLGQRLRVSQIGSSSSSSYNTYNKGSSHPLGVRTHRVKAGETLQSIARLYGTTTHDLSLWNGIGHPYTVYPGQKLLVVPP